MSAVEHLSKEMKTPRQPSTLLRLCMPTHSCIGISYTTPDLFRGGSMPKNSNPWNKDTSLILYGPFFCPIGVPLKYASQRLREIIAYSLFLQELSSAFSSSESSHVLQETFPSTSVQALHPSGHTGSGLTEGERGRVIDNVSQYWPSPTTCISKHRDSTNTWPITRVTFHTT